MDKETINKLLLIITGSSLLTFAIGSYIINYSLSEFQIVDFDMLKPHAIIVGLMFVFFVLSHAFILLIFLDIAEIGRNSIFKVFLLTGATTNSITVSPTSTTSYTVTGAQGGNTGTAISVVTVSTSTIVTKDSVWFDITFIVPSSTNTAFGYRYDTSTTRILVNGHKINAGGYNRVTDVYITNGNIIESRNYQFTSNTLTVPILMNKNDSITIEVDSVYCFFSSQTTFNFVDVLIDKNAHKPNATNITTTEKASTYNSELALAIANSGSLRYVGLAPISGQQNNQQWYIGSKFSYTWVNH